MAAEREQKHMRRRVVGWRARARAEAATMEIVIDEDMLCLVGRSVARRVGRLGNARRLHCF